MGSSTSLDIYSSFLFTSIDSPVSSDSLAYKLLVFISRTSAGTLMPDSKKIISPTVIFSLKSSVFFPSLRTLT